MPVRERESDELPFPICPCPTERSGGDLMFLEPFLEELQLFKPAVESYFAIRCNCLTRSLTDAPSAPFICGIFAAVSATSSASEYLFSLISKLA